MRFKLHGFIYSYNEGAITGKRKVKYFTSMIDKISLIADSAFSFYIRFFGPTEFGSDLFVH
jgi:hypothetical protein